MSSTRRIPTAPSAGGIAGCSQVSSDGTTQDTAGSVPFYLLVDRERGHVTLFSGPLEGDYGRYVAVAFGEKLELPEPFAFTLDTAEFGAADFVRDRPVGEQR